MEIEVMTLGEMVRESRMRRARWIVARWEMRAAMRRERAWARGAPDRRQWWRQAAHAA